ncbi:MAG: lysylphosphatidylglycerol synthase transmembrane domain-containing protein [Chitinophagales bacterium]
MSQAPDEPLQQETVPEKEKDLKRDFNPRRIYFFVALGLIFSAWLIYRSFDYEELSKINWNSKTIFWIFLGFCMIAIRHAGMIWRLNVLSDHKLSTKHSFQAITLWMFSSMVTPSTIGGAAVAMYILRKEKLSMGKSVSTSMTTIFFDQLFLAIIVPIFLLIIGGHHMFAEGLDCSSKTNLPGMHLFHSVREVFFILYFFFLGVILLLGYGLFFNANSLRSLIVGFCNIPGFRKWKNAARKTGDEILIASEEMRSKKGGYWVKVGVSTSISWLAFFFIPVCLVLAFYDTSWSSIPIIYGRQFVIWMIMLIPATPGSIGIAELSFSAMMCDVTSPGFVPQIALLWRIITYYPYLVAGNIILSRWMKRVYNG